MLYVSSYVVLLFTVQLILILKQAPSLWLLAVWGFLFFYVCIFRHTFYYPQDHPRAYYRQMVLRSILISLLFLMASSFYLHSYSNHKEQSEIETVLHKLQEFENEVFLAGDIQSSIDVDGNRVRFTLLVDQVEDQALPHGERVILTHYVQQLSERDRYNAIAKGDRWEGYAELTYPEQARNPGAFDYRRYLFYQNIHFVGQITDKGWLSHQGTNWKRIMIRHLDKQREAWIRQVDDLFSEETASIVQAMTMGYRDELSPRLSEMYQQLGIIHLLAISGLHIGILIGGLYWILGKLPLTREKMLLILFLFIPIYIYLSGAQPSVIRAGLMAMVALIFLYLRMWKHTLMGLYVVYIGTLLYNPYYMFDIGYQLSFSVTFMLIIGYSPMNNLLLTNLRKLISKFPEWLTQLVSIALLAQIASLPFVLFHFYQFSPLSWLVNIILVPIYSLFFIPGAFLITFISFLHVELVPLSIHLYEEMLHLIHGFLEKLSDQPTSSLNMGKPSIWWFLIYVLITGALLILMDLRKWWMSLICLSLFPVILAVQLLLPYLDKEAKIMMLDVGQGDAIVIELPYREEVLLIDLGGQVRYPQEEWMRRREEFEVGHDIILPYLRYRGINKIDKMIITHGHYDHFGGIQGLLGKVRIEVLARGPVAPQTEFEKLWLEEIAKHGPPVYHLGRGDQWQTKKASFHILFPQKRDKVIEETDNLHDYNIVLWNQIYDTTIIWTGDVEELGEEMILHHYPQLKVDILKVAHHGSQTSTTANWLHTVEPQAGLISLGRNNPFGHPHADVLQRLEQNDIPIFRTDQHGGVMVTISPERVEVIPTLQETKVQIK